MEFADTEGLVKLRGPRTEGDGRSEGGRRYSHRRSSSIYMVVRDNGIFPVSEFSQPGMGYPQSGYDELDSTLVPPPLPGQIFRGPVPSDGGSDKYGK